MQPVLQALIASLSWLGLHRLAGRSGAAASSGDIDAVLLFEQLIGELHLAALQTAVVTSGVNALGAGVRLQNPLALQDLGPLVPTADKITMPRRARELIGVAQKNLAPVRDFFAELPAAQKSVEAFCVDADAFGTEEAGFFDLPAVADKWRCLSLRALTAVVALERDVSRCLPQRYTRNTPVLKKLLRNVIEGGQPCVDSQARVQLPDLPQRRAAVRPNVRLPCILEHHGRTFQAVAKDISTGGVGLEDAPALTCQDVVLVEFEDGHCFAGLVVWSKGKRAGVKFDAPLKPSHPLLAPGVAAAA
jgi:PilZ domain-containing protein